MAVATDLHRVSLSPSVAVVRRARFPATWRDDLRYSFVWVYYSTLCVGCQGGKDFLLFSSTDAHTALCARSRLAFDAISLPRRKEMAKEKTLGHSLRDLPSVRRFTTNGGDFAFAKVRHLRGIYPTPQMGLLLVRFLLLRCKRKIFTIARCVALGKSRTNANRESKSPRGLLRV